MMGVFNDSGLITLGFGRDQRLVTQGYGSSFEVGGPAPFLIKKEFDYYLSTPVLRENFLEIKIYSPLEIKGSREISISLGVSKEIKESISLLAGIDYSKLKDILDAI